MPVDLKQICKIHRNKWPKQSWITIKSENFYKIHMKIEFFEVFSPKYKTDRRFSVQTFRYGIVCDLGGYYPFFLSFVFTSF